MSGAEFIANLPSFTRFSDVADPLRFIPAPQDWRVYCCDVVNSTQAIREGRYKAVNMMCTAPGFSDTRQRYAASWVVIVAAIQFRRVSAGLR